MYKSKTCSEEINLISGYKMKRKTTSKDYKAEYKRLFPTKMSSSSFLISYTLFILSKSPGPLYGKEMLDKLQETLGSNIWHPSHGTYYPLLDRMEMDGLIKKTSTKLKNYYTLTELGLKELSIRLNELKPMLTESINFFHHALMEMYNEDKSLQKSPNNSRIESNPKIQSNIQTIEISIISRTKEHKTEIKINALK